MTYTWQRLLLLLLAVPANLILAENDCTWHPCQSGCSVVQCNPGTACQEQISSCENATCYPKAACVLTTCPAIFDRLDYGCIDQPYGKVCLGDDDCQTEEYCCYNGPTCKSTCLKKVKNTYPTMDFIIPLKITDDLTTNRLKGQLILAGWNKMEEIFNGVKYFAGVTNVDFSIQGQNGTSNMTVSVAFNASHSTDDIFIVDGLSAWFHQAMVGDKIFRFNDKYSYKIVSSELSSNIFFSVKFKYNGRTEKIPYIGPCEFLKIRKVCNEGICESSFNHQSGITVRCNCGEYLGPMCDINAENVIKVSFILDMEFQADFSSVESGHFKMLKSSLVAELNKILEGRAGFTSVERISLASFVGQRTSVEVYLKLNGQAKSSRKLFFVSALAWSLQQSFTINKGFDLGQLLGSVTLAKFPNSASYISLSFYDESKQSMTSPFLLTDVCTVFNARKLCLNSVCIDKDGEPFCNCDSGYEGDFCTVEVTDRSAIEIGFVIDYEWNSTNLDMNSQITKALLNSIDLSSIFSLTIIRNYQIVRLEEATNGKLKIIVKLQFISQQTDIDYFSMTSSITVLLIKRFAQPDITIKIGTKAVTLVAIKNDVFFELSVIGENGDFEPAVIVPQDVCFVYKEKTLCQNNGVCIQENDEPVCSCPDAYEGRFCEKNRLSLDKLMMEFCLDLNWADTYNDSKSAPYKNIVHDVIMPKLNALIQKFNLENPISLNMTHFGLLRGKNNKVCATLSLCSPMQPDVVAYAELFAKVTDFFTLRITKTIGAFNLINFGTDQPAYLRTKIFNRITSTYDTVVLASGCNLFNFFHYCGSNGMCYVDKMKSRCRCTPFTTGKQCELYTTPQRECRIDKPLMKGDFYSFCDKTVNNSCPQGYTCQAGFSTPTLNICCPTLKTGSETVIFNFTLGIAWIDIYTNMTAESTISLVRGIEKVLNEIFHLKEEYIGVAVTSLRPAGGNVRVVVKISYISNDPENKFFIIAELASVWQSTIMINGGKLNLGELGGISLVPLYDETYLTVSMVTTNQMIVFEDACLFINAIFPCQHGGTCVNKNNRVFCSCITGYAGYFCDQFEPIKEVCFSGINQCVNSIDVKAMNIEYICKLSACFLMFEEDCRTEKQFSIISASRLLAKACRMYNMDACLVDKLQCIYMAFKGDYFDVTNLCRSSAETIKCLNAVNLTECKTDAVDALYNANQVDIWYRHQCIPSCQMDSCQEMLQTFDSNSEEICQFLDYYSTCLWERLTNCGPNSWPELLTAITVVKDIINQECSNVTLPTDIYDECGYGCFMVLLSDLSQSLYTGYPHYCSSSQMFSTCLERSKQNCVNKQQLSINETLASIHNTLESSFNPECFTAECNLTSAIECSINVKNDIMKAIRWDMKQWSKEGCVLNHWILPKSPPQEEEEEENDDDDCWLYNPCVKQCPNTDLIDDVDEKSMPTLKDNTCISEFTWGALCLDLDISKTCIEHKTLQCSRNVDTEVAGNWHSVAEEHNLDKVCLGVTCSQNVGLQCVANLTDIAFKKALGVIGWMKYCQDDVDLMKCLISSVGQCTPHVNGVLVPYMHALLFDLKTAKCEQGMDTEETPCFDKAQTLVGHIKKFTLLLLNHTMQVDLPRQIMCNEWMDLRTNISDFIKDNATKCKEFKLIIEQLMIRLDQLFQSFCVSPECEITRAYKCVNELSFWKKNHRLPKWSILKAMWDKGDYDVTEEENWEWDDKIEKSSSTDKANDGDDRQCWMIAEVKKCIGWASVNCTNRAVQLVEVALTSAKEDNPKASCESPCSKYPCQHGGSCTDNNDGSFTCDCLPEYTGENCEIALCKESEAKKCLNMYMANVFIPVFNTENDFSWFNGGTNSSICSLTTKTVACITLNTEHCSRDIKERYISFSNVVLRQVNLTCQSSQLCEWDDFTVLEACLVPQLTGIDGLGLITDEHHMVKLDVNTFCGVWPNIGKCLLAKDTCDFFRTFYIAIGNYICPKPTCSIEKSLQCQAGLYKLQEENPSGVPVCGCQEETDFCSHYGHYVTCIARSQVSCSSWWNTWSEQVITTIQHNITNIEKCSNPCVGNLCENGATCEVTDQESYECRCPEGYDGKYCENDVCAEEKALKCFYELWEHAFDTEGSSFLLGGLCGIVLERVQKCISSSIERCPYVVKYKFKALLGTTIQKIEEACKGYELPPRHGCPMHEWVTFAACLRENFITGLPGGVSATLDLGTFCNTDLTCLVDKKGCDWYRELTLTFIDLFCQNRPMCNVESSLICLESYETNHIPSDDCLITAPEENDSQKQEDDSTISENKDDNNSKEKNDSKEDKSIDKGKKSPFKKQKKDDTDMKSKMKSEKNDNSKVDDDDKSQDKKDSKMHDPQKSEMKSDKKDNSKDDNDKSQDNKDSKMHDPQKSEMKSEKKDSSSSKEIIPPGWDCPSCKLYSYGKICVYAEVEQCSGPLKDWIKSRFEVVAGKMIMEKCDDPCLPNPCQNGGTCSHQWNNEESKIEYTCSCPLGYGGELCDQVICRPDLAVTCVYQEITKLFEMDFLDDLCKISTKILACGIHINKCDYNTWWHWNNTLSVFIEEIDKTCKEPLDRDCPISSLSVLLDCADDLFNLNLIKQSAMSKPCLNIDEFCRINVRCLKASSECTSLRYIFLTFFDSVCPTEWCSIKNSLECIWKFEDGTGYGPKECSNQDKEKSHQSQLSKFPYRPCSNDKPYDDNVMCEDGSNTCEPSNEKTVSSDDRQHNDLEDLFDFDFNQYYRSSKATQMRVCSWGWMNDQCFWDEDMSDKQDNLGMPFGLGHFKGKMPSFINRHHKKSNSEDTTDDDLICSWYNETTNCIANYTEACSPVWKWWIQDTFKKTKQVVEEICIDPCLPNPCLNNGKCENRDKDNYICDCPRGWKGLKCEERTCKVEKAAICISRFVENIIMINMTETTNPGLSSICGEVNTVLQCIETNIIDCSADDQMYFTGFRELIIHKVQTYCLNQTTCSTSEAMQVFQCVDSSGIRDVMDLNEGVKSLCWANINCLLSMENDCWMGHLIKDILIFACDIKNIQCDIKQSLQCIASYAAQVEWQLADDLSSLFSNIGLLPVLDPDKLPVIPGIGYDFCLSINASISCVDEYSLGCTSSWGKFLTSRRNSITQAASINVICKDPCANHPCDHGICEADGFAPKCYCYPGYTGKYCEKEINGCNFKAFKSCFADVKMVLTNTAYVPCVNITKSLECLENYSLTCAGFFGEGVMASYIFLLSRAYMNTCKIIDPKAPLVNFDECVASKITNCTQTAVIAFINETETFTFDGGSNFTEYQFTASCSAFMEAKMCVRNISVSCKKSSKATLRTVEMIQTTLSVSVDLQCSTCEALKAKKCIAVMQTAITDGDFCDINDYRDLFPTAKPPPPCTDICGTMEYIDQCVTTNLKHCQNATKESVVTEWRSVKASLSDQCMSACWPNPCLVGGICNVINGTDHFCTCTVNDRLGQDCEIASSCMFNFGPNFGDKEIRVDMGKKIDIGRDIQLYDNLYDSFYISVNGYISFSGKHKFQSFMAFPTSGMTILAPFFAEQDMRCGGRIFYQIYRRSSKNNEHEKLVLEKATNDVQNALTNSSVVEQFEANVVIVVTWYNIMETPCDDHTEDNTYQLRVVSSRYQSFVFYSYHQLNVETDHAFVGWSTEFGTSMISELHGDELAGYQHVKQNNRSLPGCWFWSFLPVKKPPPPADKCLTWIASTIDLNDVYLPTCPCNYRLITSDQRFRHSYSKDKHFYANSTKIYETEKNGVKYQYQQVCSYSANGNLETSRPFGSYATVINEPAGYSDSEAFEFCCRMSTRHCNEFFSIRPIGNCFAYQSPLIALLWGDPHIITIDRHKYTFNGIGDYILLRIGGETSPEFEIQGRMEPVHGGNATIYTGFAASVKKGFKHVVILDKQRKDLKLIVNGEEKVPLAKTSYKYDVTWTDSSSLQIDFSNFPNFGIESLSIKATAGMLSMVPQFSSRLISSRPVGLMGTTSNNTFLSSTRNRIPISDPDCVIFHQFGQTWRVTDRSLFNNPVPAEGQGWCGHPCDNNMKFTEDELQESCGDSETCRFDACATGDLVIASTTRAIESDFKEKTSVFANSPPQITGDSLILARVGEQIQLMFSVTDKDFDPWIIYPSDSYNVTSATFDNRTATFTWTPTDLSPVNISFVAEDSHGAHSSTFQVKVVLCSGCSGHGECNFDPDSSSKEEFNFKLAECECQTGWEGLNCSDDEDGCREEPCGNGGSCRDTAAQYVLKQGPYVCLSCGPGLLLSGTLCKVLVPTVPQRAITDIRSNNIGLVLYLNNLPWTDYYFNLQTKEAKDLIGLLEPVLNTYHSKIPTHFHTTIRQLYPGSLAVEQQIQLTELSYSTLSSIAQQLKDTTADGVKIGNVVYPVKKTTIISPDENEVAITDDCVLYDALHLCQNGGFCSMKDSSPECQCLSDTANPFCEEESSSTDLKLIIPLTVIAVLFLLGIVIIVVWAAGKVKISRMPPAYQSEKDTAQLERESCASESDLSLNKYAPKYHSWWPGRQPHAGSYA